jgi:hypothetical protein
MFKMLKIIFISVLLLCGFSSCTETSREKLLIGKWKYSGMERHDGTAVDLKDSTANLVQKKNEGVILVFNQDKTFESGKEKNNGFESFGKETWRLSDDQNFILTKGNDGQEHKFQIIKLTRNKFVFIFNVTSEEYLVFTKTQ